MSKVIAIIGEAARRAQIAQTGRDPGDVVEVDLSTSTQEVREVIARWADTPDERYGYHRYGLLGADGNCAKQKYHDLPARIVERYPNRMMVWVPEALGTSAKDIAEAREVASHESVNDAHPRDLVDGEEMTAALPLVLQRLLRRKTYTYRGYVLRPEVAEYMSEETRARVSSYIEEKNAEGRRAALAGMAKAAHKALDRLLGVEEC